MNPLPILHTFAAIYVLCEAVNRLHRMDFFADAKTWWGPWLVAPVAVLAFWRWQQHQVLAVFTALAWSLLALGAAGYLVAPLVGHADALLPDDLFAFGTAALIALWRAETKT